MREKINVRGDFATGSLEGTQRVIVDRDCVSGEMIARHLGLRAVVDVFHGQVQLHRQIANAVSAQDMHMMCALF